MKGLHFIAVFTLLVASSGLWGKSTHKMTLKFVDTNGLPIEHLFISIDDWNVREAETNRLGITEVTATVEKPMSRVVVYTHHNRYIPVAIEDSLGKVDGIAKSATFSYLSANKGSVEITMQHDMVGRLNAPTLRTIQTFKVQLASFSQDIQGKENELEAMVKMPVTKSFKNGRVVYSVSAPSLEEGRKIAANINEQKFKEIAGAFVVIETQKVNSFRIQLCATSKPMLAVDLQKLNTKIAATGSKVQENMVIEESVKYKYLLVDEFETKEAAAPKLEKLKSLGITGYVVPFDESTKAVNIKLLKGMTGTPPPIKPVPKVPLTPQEWKKNKNT